MPSGGPFVAEPVEHPLDLDGRPLEADAQPADVAFAAPAPTADRSSRGRPASNSMATGRAGERTRPASSFSANVEVGHVADEQHRRLGQRANHQRHLRDDAQRAERAGHQPAHVVAGGVLHHAAAAGKRHAGSVDGREAEHIVAHRAVGISSRAGGIDRHRAADGRPVGLRNIDRQPLPLSRPECRFNSAIVMPASTVIVMSSAG